MSTLTFNEILHSVFSTPPQYRPFYFHPSNVCPPYPPIDPPSQSPTEKESRLLNTPQLTNIPTYINDYYNKRLLESTIPLLAPYGFASTSTEYRQTTCPVDESYYFTEDVIDRLIEDGIAYRVNDEVYFTGDKNYRTIEAIEPYDYDD